MPRCETCGRSLEEPSAFPYCTACLSQIGVGKDTRDYLEELIQQEPENGESSTDDAPEV